MDQTREDRWANLSSVIQDTDKHLLDAGGAGTSYGAPSMYVPRPRPVSPPRAAHRPTSGAYDGSGYGSGYGAPLGAQPSYGDQQQAGARRSVLREHRPRATEPQHGSGGYSGAAHGEPPRGDWGGATWGAAADGRAKENMGPYGSTKPMAVRARGVRAAFSHRGCALLASRRGVAAVVRQAWT